MSRKRNKKSKDKVSKKLAKGTLILTQPKTKNPYPVVALKKRGSSMTVKRLVDIPYEGVIVPFKFKVSADGKTIRVSYKGGDEKLVIHATDLDQADSWRLDVKTPRDYEGDDYDATYYKTPYQAYLGGLAEVWDIVAERVN